MLACAGFNMMQRTTTLLRNRSTTVIVFLMWPSTIVLFYSGPVNTHNLTSVTNLGGFL